MSDRMAKVLNGGISADVPFIYYNKSFVHQLYEFIYYMNTFTTGIHMLDDFTDEISVVYMFMD